jgi:hypothetical protein
MKRFLICISLFLLPLALCAAAPKAYQFSADMVMTTQGHSMSGKIFVNADRTRMEMSMPGQSVVNIVRRDKQVAWMLMPDQKTYMEMPLKNQGQPSPFDGSVDYKYTLVGPDTVDGHPCKKYQFSATVGGQAVKGFHWLASDLKDLPIQWSDENGASLTTLKNAKIGPSPDALFELPAGYTKTDMGSMMQHRK